MYRAVLKVAVLVACSVLSSVAVATELKARSFTNQWDKAVALTDQTELVIYSHHRDGSAMVKAVLETIDIAPLKDNRWLYVADISAMPSLITKMFALPKMRDYPFPMALIKEEGELKQWPVKEEMVSVYLLDKLTISSAEYFSDEAALSAFLEQKRAQ